jgi:hypothetical protein
MRDVEKPFGIKVIFLVALLGGFFGILEAIFASDKALMDMVWDSEALALIGAFFNNAAFLRTVVVLFSFFNLWLANAVISLKKIGWYALLFDMGAMLVLYLSLLVIVNARRIPLDNMQKVGITFRIIVDLCWFIYVLTVQSYFVR